MKLNTIINLTCGTFLFLAASCSQDDVLLDSHTDDGNLHSYTLYLDAEAPSFEKVDEGETRASGSSWENGDVIYVIFSNGGSTVVSNATYNSSLGAFQFSTASLNTVSDASCSVYYFRGGSFSVSGNTVTLDKYTAIFTDTSAKYTCSSNVITMSAAFKPYTWRLCFKGTTGTQVKLKSASNVVYNTSLNLTSGSFSTKADSVNLLVQSDGYTPCVYGLFASSTNTVRVKVGGTYYSRSLSSSKLAVGQSGYFTVPTIGNHANWSTSRDKSGFEYVDLGLPSGTLWAKCNLGASSEEEYGDFYAWGETSGYDGLDRTFNWSTYKLCSGTSSSLTKYNSSDGLTTLESTDDAATVQYGYGWRIPTREEWTELDRYTTKSNETINGIKGRRLKSTKNSNSIFLPFGGYFDGSTYISAGTNANYWASTLSSTKIKAYIAYTPNSGAIRTNGTLDRCLTQAIRPVYDPSSAIPKQTFTVNGVSFTMVQVEGGTFTMGATSEQGSDAFDDEIPAHQVTLSTFLIGETEVTQELWVAMMDSNPSWYYEENYPVESVTWNECQDFISKLNAATGMTFRLPTEAEWEYAARGGNRSRGHKYSGSNTIDEVAWYFYNSGDKYHDIATKQPNELGIYDMSGNVSEWCSDWYGNDYYNSSSQTNPKGPDSGQYRVCRGGNGSSNARSCRSSNRSYAILDWGGQSNLGLRLVLSE